MELGLLAALSAVVLKGLLLGHGYLASNTAFPQPLPPDEEAKCLRQLREGDFSARNLLIEHNLRLVAHIVKKFESSYDDVEDLISVGTIGLIKGVETFNPEKGTRLATYAARCIENEGLMSNSTVDSAKCG